MSDKNKARRARAEVYFDGVNISQAIGDNLISLSYTDNEEDETDDLQIRLHDRDGIWMEQWLGAAIQSAASGAAATAASSNTTPYKVTAKSGLNVRSGASTNHKILGTLVYGAKIDVVSISGNWALISYKGVNGYVYTKYIQAVSDSSAGTSGGEAYQVTAKSGLNVRSGAGTSYGRRGALVYGATVGVLSISGKWARIQYGGKDGYLYTDYLQKVEKSAGAVKTSQGGLTVQAAIVRENWHTDGGDEVLDCGSFELDSVTASGPPSEIVIRCTSLPFSTQIRQTKRNQSWSGYRLSRIAQEMAQKNGMACLYESSADPTYEQLEQSGMSDISFLSILCHRAGISLKASNNIIVLFDQAAYENKAAVREISFGDGSYNKYKLQTGSADTKYASCRVRYTNPDTGKLITATANAEGYRADDKNKQQLEVYAKVTGVGQAQALAEKSLRLKNKYAYSATFAMPGDPRYVAGLTVRLKGFGAWSGQYIIKRAQHVIGQSGYTTDITLRKV